MTKMKWMMAIVVILGNVMWAQAGKPAEKRTASQILDKEVSGVDRDFVPAAGAMAEDKYSFAPTNGEFKGVRTFAEEVKHVAAVNYEFAAAILGEKPPVEIGKETGPESVKTKAEIEKFLKDSFAYLHKAIASINEKNLIEPMKSPWGEGTVTRLGIAVEAAAHPWDHYGQMVEYLRMNGIVPPASR